MRLNFSEFFSDPLTSLFAPLRFLTVVGTLMWIYYAVPSHSIRNILLIAIGVFSFYSIIFYFILRKYIRYFKRLYLFLLIPDVFFVTVMVHYTGMINSPFFLGYYLVGALFSFYYGLEIGLIAVLVSILSIVTPAVSGHLIEPGSLLRLLFKLFFLVILALGSGSIAAQNAYHLALREKLVEKLQLLHEVNNRLMTKMDLNQRLALIAEEGAKALETLACVVLLYDEDEKLVPRAMYNVDNEAIKSLRLATKEQLDSTFAGISARQGETIIINDILELKPDHPFRAELERLNLKSTVCTPIVFENRRLGVFCNYNDVPMRFKEEEHNIASTFAAQIALSIENSKLVRRVIEKEEKVFKAELKVAKDIQSRFLLKKPPKTKNLDMGLVYQPAREVGGDFFDFYKIDGKLNFTIGDVVGKGTPAALFVSLMSYASNALASFHIGPQEILKEMNEILLQRTSSDFFVTMMYCEFDSENRELVIYNAGHSPALHFDSASGKTQFLRMKGLLLGIEKTVTYPPRKITMHEGDIVVFYTDGLIEARRPDQEPIGMEGLKSLLQLYTDLPAWKLAEKLREECLLGSIEYLVDDCTIIAVKGA